MEDMRKRIIIAMPMISVFLFLAIGFIGNELGHSWWHPAWVVFLLIPICPFLLGVKKIVITYPVVVTIIYILMGLLFPDFGWHPGWIIFLTIPIVAVLAPKRKKNQNKDHYDSIDSYTDN